MTGINRRTTDVLVTGAAGFIGYHLSRRLLDDGYSVTGLDNLNDYYDVNLKMARLRILQGHERFCFTAATIADSAATEKTFAECRPTIVVNLAAQAGVRYSLQNPSAYIQSNLVGFANILEACRNSGVEHLLYASSSSVYGGNVKVPFEECDPVEHPVSLYAATKRSNELMADSYAHLYGVPCTGLRLFTVYGPYGRPDMAYYKFCDSYFANEPISLFTDGDPAHDLSRDFTFVDDVVESISRLLNKPPVAGHSHRILNIGGSTPEKLSRFVALLESALGEAIGHEVVFEKVLSGFQPGDVLKTYADSSRLQGLTGFVPHTPLHEGLRRFVEWYVHSHIGSTV